MSDISFARTTYSIVLDSKSPNQYFKVGCVGNKKTRVVLTSQSNVSRLNTEFNKSNAGDRFFVCSEFVFESKDDMYLNVIDKNKKKTIETEEFLKLQLTPDKAKEDYNSSITTIEHKRQIKEILDKAEKEGIKTISLEECIKGNKLPILIKEKREELPLPVEAPKVEEAPKPVAKPAAKPVEAPKVETPVETPVSEAPKVEEAPKPVAKG